MDRNGYNPSMLATEDGVCKLCGLCTQTVRHEVFYGTGTRALSKRYGLWVDLCPHCHAKVHQQPGGEADKALRREAKLMFIRHIGCEDEFIRIFIKGDIKNWEIK
jgi:5-methylcytosine-specific restriction endonuclease McrA